MSAATLSIPPLRQGERLSREEFHRRYEAMPENTWAELLDGVVYMASPVSFEHDDPNTDLNGWLYIYRMATPGVWNGSHITTRLTELCEVQPDGYLRILETHGGESFIDEDRYLSGVPDLLGEVSRSSADHDSRVKLPIYRKAGVREFIMWRVDDEEIDWHILRDGNYELLQPGSDGIVRGETFPGLWLDVKAMIRRDGAAVQRVLQHGIASPQHAEFVARLARGRSKG